MQYIYIYIYIYIMYILLSTNVEFKNLENFIHETKSILGFNSGCCQRVGNTFILNDICDKMSKTIESKIEKIEQA